MFKHIVAQGFYQMFWMFLFLYGLPRHMPQYAVNSDEDFLRVASVLFNTFIFAQVQSGSRQGGCVWFCFCGITWRSSFTAGAKHCTT